MANEAEILYELEPAIPYTVANATAITKGAVLRLTDPATASAATADYDVIAGIAKEDKIASDGKVRLGLYKRGIFKMTLSGSGTIGDAVGVFGDGSNKIGVLDVTGQTLSGARCLGTLEETGTNGETVRVFVDIQQTWPSI